MNINKTLYNGCRPHFLKYGCDDDEIFNFLFTITTREEKQDKAINIINGIIKPHGKEPLLDFLTCLANIEYEINELQPRLRDHVVHAVFTYLLGIYINERLMRKIARKVDPYQWKIACLFHDIAYPVEIAHNLTRTYCKMVYKIGIDYYRPLPIIQNISMLSNLYKLIKDKRTSSYSVINKCLKKWGININSKKIYNTTIKDGDICHGMLSALTILYLIDKFYQQNNPHRNCTETIVGNSNWDETFFIKDVIPACAAIFLHNIDKEHFLNYRIDPQKAPIAFLLKLCDSLQEWQRPSKEKPEGESPEEFDLEIDNHNHLVYHAWLSTKRINDIEEDIKSTLVGMNYFKIKGV